MPLPVSLSYSFTVVEKPVAVLTYDNISALFGAIIQLDGRQSYDPQSLPLTFQWTFAQKPTGSNLSSFNDIRDGSKAVSFIPDKIGLYEVQLIVNNGALDSDPVTANVGVGLTETPCGEGIIPEADFLWNYLSDFWKLVEDRDYITSTWSAMMQMVGADLTKLWSNDLNKSLATIQEHVPRRWQKVDLRLDLSGETQRVLAGYNNDGVGGSSGELPVRQTVGTGTSGLDTFTATLVMPDGHSIIPTSLRVVSKSDPTVFIATDDGEGSLNGTGFAGTVDYDDGSVVIAESSATAWTTGEDVVVRYRTSPEASSVFFVEDGAYLYTETIAEGTSTTSETFDATLVPPFAAASITPGSVEVQKAGSVVGTDDGAGNITGSVTGTVDYETLEIAVVDTTNVFDAGDEVDIQYGVDIDDLRKLDQSGTARGRILVVDGEGYTVDRLLKTGDFHVIHIDEEALTPAEETHAWRIPHLLHTPNLDLEDFGVSTGDIVVFNISRKDVGLSSEIQAQVVGVDGDRIGFEFTLGALTSGGDTIDLGQYETAVRELGLVGASAEDSEVESKARTLLAFMPAGINLSSRPFTSYRITIRAKKIILNNNVRIHSRIVSMPALQEALHEADVVLRENQDYIIGDGEIQFQTGLFTLSDPSPELLWAECSMVDNTPAIENNFGRMVGILEGDLTSTLTRVSYLASVKGLWYAITSGPSVENIRLGMQVLMGLPFAEERGVILDVTDQFFLERTQATGRREKIGEGTSGTTDSFSVTLTVKDGWAIVPDTVTLWNGGTAAESSGNRVADEDGQGGFTAVGSNQLTGSIDYDTSALVVTEQNQVWGAGEEVYVEYDVAPWTGRMMVKDLDEADEETGRRRIYYYPTPVGLEDNPRTGEVFQKDDYIEQWDIVSKGIEVVDYVKDPTWWLKSFSGLEILKFFVFKVLVDSEVFDPEMVSFSLDFLKKVKPAYTRAIAAAVMDLEDTPIDELGDEFSEKFAGLTGWAESDYVSPESLIGMSFYDKASGMGLPPLRLDHKNGLGAPLYFNGSTPFMCRVPLLLKDVETRKATGPDRVEAVTATGYFSNARARVDGTSTIPVQEGDLLVIFPGRAGAGTVSYGLYEITEATDSNTVVLGSQAPGDEPSTFEYTTLDPDAFDYGTGLLCCVLRRMTNPVLVGSDLSTSGERATSAAAGFIAAGVMKDDHLIIENGETDEGEYRIKAITSGYVDAVDMDGATTSFTGGTGQSFRVVRSSVTRSRETVGKSTWAGASNDVYVDLMDPGPVGGSPPGVPLDVFTPWMEGNAEVVISGSDKPVNDGIFSITEYIHPGRVKISNPNVSDAATDDSSAVATVMVDSRYHHGIEYVADLGPAEVFDAEVT